MKVLFVTRELNGVMGGLERQILKISSHLAGQNLEIVIVSLEKKSGQPFFSDLTEGVELKSIIAGDPSQHANFRTRIARQQKFRRILQEVNPDVIVTFMIGSLIFAKPMSFLFRIPVVLSERNSPDIYRLTSAKKLRWLFFLVAGTAKKITVQFPSYAQKYPSFMRRRIVSIPNEVPKFPSQRKVPAKSNLVFGYAGRFSFQKRIDVLIHSFARIHQELPDTKLLIFGYGEQKEYLESIVLQLNLSNCVEFREEQKDISKVFDEIDVFCLLSLWEGFPNVLAEALAYGVPAAGFSSCDGVNDLILDGVNGWKVSCEDPINSGYRLLLRAYHGYKNNDVSSKSCQDSVAKYSSERIYDSWKSILIEVSRN